MTYRHTQLNLNFDAVPETVAIAAEVTVLAPIVDLAGARSRREHEKKEEDKRVLMERIRARVAHLQA